MAQTIGFRSHCLRQTGPEKEKDQTGLNLIFNPCEGSCPVLKNVPSEAQLNLRIFRPRVVHSSILKSNPVINLVKLLGYGRPGGQTSHNILIFINIYDKKKFNISYY